MAARTLWLHYAIRPILRASASTASRMRSTMPTKSFSTEKASTVECSPANPITLSRGTVLLPDLQYPQLKSDRMRKRHASSAGLKSFGVIFGGIWLAVGAPFLVACVYTAMTDKLQQKQLIENGRRTHGIVLAKSYSPDSTQAFSVDYRFTASSGAVVKGTTQVTGDVWDRLVERGPIEVTYLPDRTAVARVQGHSRDTLLSLIFIIVGGILTLVGGFIFVVGVRNSRRGP
jgi:uncharacterized protein DUF3592